MTNLDTHTVDGQLACHAVWGIVYQRISLPGLWTARALVHVKVRLDLIVFNQSTNQPSNQHHVTSFPTEVVFEKNWKSEKVELQIFRFGASWPWRTVAHAVCSLGVWCGVSRSGIRNKRSGYVMASNAENDAKSKLAQWVLSARLEKLNHYFGNGLNCFHPLSCEKRLCFVVFTCWDRCFLVYLPALTN